MCAHPCAHIYTRLCTQTHHISLLMEGVNSHLRDHQITAFPTPRLGAALGKQGWLGSWDGSLLQSHSCGSNAASKFNKKLSIKIKGLARMRLLTVLWGVGWCSPACPRGEAEAGPTGAPHSHTKASLAQAFTASSSAAYSAPPPQPSLGTNPSLNALLSSSGLAHVTENLPLESSFSDDQCSKS